MKKYYSSRLLHRRATETRLNFVHGGMNAGRRCWIVSDTLCAGDVQGTFAKKFKDCSKCDFYEAVKKEEFTNFQLSAVLTKKLAG